MAAIDTVSELTEELAKQRATNAELIAALQTIVPHVLHYATMPNAHAEAHKDAACARASIANAIQVGSSVVAETGALLVRGGEIAERTGDSENEMVRFSWTDDDLEASEKFFRLLDIAGAITIDDGALLVGGSEIEERTGDPENEVVRFSWTDGECEYSDVLTEGGIAEGVFDSDGKFVCENREGEKTVFRFFALERLGAEHSIQKKNEFNVNDICDRLLDSEEHACESAIPEVAEDAVNMLQQMSREIARLEGLVPEVARAGNVEMLSETQKQIAKLYCGGDLAHVADMTAKEADNCGDGLLSFLLREAQDASNLSEYLGMLETAQDQLNDLRVNVENITEFDFEKSYQAAGLIADTKGGWKYANCDEARSYVGKIMDLTEHHVVQSLGKTAVVHEKQNLDVVPNKGEVLTIAYNGLNRGGKVIAESKDRDKTVAR